MLDYRHAVGKKNANYLNLSRLNLANKATGCDFTVTSAVGSIQWWGSHKCQCKQLLYEQIQNAMGWDESVLASGMYNGFERFVYFDDLNEISSGTRSSAVKAAMQHCWKNYKLRAFGADEIKPVSGMRNENWGGMGMTLLDSLDTLWLMGMKSSTTPQNGFATI